MIQLIINPAAGNGRARLIGKQVTEYLVEKNVECTVVYTEHMGHATELARQAAEAGVSSVIAVGGDGTVSETAAGLIHTSTALGIVSAGTGNDFAKILRVPKAWKAALDFILTHPGRPIDAGTMNDTFFVNVCGAGFDVMVLDYALKAKKFVRGILPYLYGVIRAIKNFTPFSMHIELDAETTIDGDFMICSIANGGFFGGGIPIAPMADVTDGKFDVVVVDAVPRWKIPFYLPALLGGTLLKKKVARHYRAAKCALAAKGMRLNLDGEIIAVESTAFTCMKDALMVHW